MVEKKVRVDDGVYLIKKSNFFGWRLIYPIKNEDGTINWFNLLTGGSWANLIKVILIVSILVSSVLLYRHDINAVIEYYKQLCSIGINNSLI